MLSARKSTEGNGERAERMRVRLSGPLAARLPHSIGRKSPAGRHRLHRSGSRVPFIGTIVVAVKRSSLAVWSDYMSACDVIAASIVHFPNAVPSTFLVGA